MAFSMQVAAKQKAITDCPHVSDEAKGELSDASAPPMKLVHIGPEGDGGFDIGQETVMFRHEEKFHKPPAVAVRIPASLTDDEAATKLEAINAAQYVRAGEDLAVRLAVVETGGLDADAASSRAKALAEKSRVPFVVAGEDAGVVGAAVAAIADKRPLVCKASGDGADTFIKIAADNKCPLAVGADSLEALADLAKSAADAGAADLVLAFDGRKTAQTVRDITIARRAALRKNFRALGYPVLVDVSHDDPMREALLASTFVAKYAGVVIINGVEPAELLPILTTAQNLYTDPQVPNTVEAKLCPIGDVNEESPVLFTTNFSLTYFCVEGEVERSKQPTYISVVETEGLGVLNAFAGDKLSPEKVVKTLEEQGVADKVKHRKLIIPGLLPSFRAEIEDTSDWEVVIGPENASGIPSLLSEGWK